MAWLERWLSHLLLTALPEVLSSVPSTHIVAHNHLLMCLRTAIATSTSVVTSATGPQNLGTVLRRKVHGNVVSWNRGIPYKECSNVLALVGKRICVLSLNIALLQVLLRIDILTYS